MVKLRSFLCYTAITLPLVTTGTAAVTGQNGTFPQCLGALCGWDGVAEAEEK